MTPGHRSLVITAFVILLFAWAGPPASAQHAGHGAGAAPEPDRPYLEKLRVGEDGGVTFTAPTIVGEWLFKPGKYRFEHVVEGEEHFVGFSRNDAPQSGPAAARVKCRLGRLRKPAKKTEVHVLVHGGGVRKVDKIQVQGESVKHVF